MAEPRRTGTCKGWSGTYGQVKDTEGYSYLVYPDLIPREQAANRRLYQGEVIEFTAYEDANGRAVAADILLLRPRPPKAETNLRGKVITWFEKKQFGFIESSADRHLNFFVHYKEVHEQQHLKVGQEVAFDSALGKDGRLRALNVFPL